ncbi:MAG: hypothetical protein M1828_006718 [Chrysothrix sp. TS-e1954]|nr:MAG: hypothetical protein M1828_006718 [Chrysothrix sp. TS-e1954]
MAPVLHLVRHAQGVHNLNVANHQIHDPLLTPYGKQQCAHLATTFPYIKDVEMIAASPLKRTIYTALLAFQDQIAAKKLRVVAMPEMQETSDLPCDTGSDREELEREFAGQPVDLSLVGSGWNNKRGLWAPNSQVINERCKSARRWLRDRPEKDIIVVTHGGLLHYFTEDWSGSEKFAGTGWANTEFRTYTFDATTIDSASVTETDESLTRRRGIEKPLSEAEQRNLKRTATVDLQHDEGLKPSSMMAVSAKARLKDRLQERDWIGGYGAQEFFVRFNGPGETPFAGGVWKIHVELPDQYPYKSPSIGFVNRIFHPNIDEMSGSVCLDVINQTWSPMYDMINIFEVFLPQLLRYPNPTDPLNGEAAALMMRDAKSYEARVKESVKRHASKDAADEAGNESESEGEMSSVGSYASGEEDEPAGNMDEL